MGNTFKIARKTWISWRNAKHRPSRNAHQQPPGSRYLDTFHVWNLIINKARSWWWSSNSTGGESRFKLGKTKKNCWVRPPRMSEHVWFEGSNKLKLHLLRNLLRLGFRRVLGSSFPTKGFDSCGSSKNKGSFLSGFNNVEPWRITINLEWIWMNEMQCQAISVMKQHHVAAKFSQSQGG